MQNTYKCMWFKEKTIVPFAYPKPAVNTFYMLIDFIWKI